MRRRLLLIILLALPAPLSFALPSDGSQPITIESDRAERNDKKRTTVYEGSVVIVQGTIKIRADKVTLYSDANNQVSRIVCIGKPAHYQQQPKPQQGLLFASGDTIEYHLAADRIDLLKNASLEQNGTTITGDKIHYDLKAEVVKATAGDDPKKRIQMVIPPSNQKEGN
ncbi:lipopolysaccharide transport periplasmic protein LptA [Porticoccus sp.]